MTNDHQDIGLRVIRVNGIELGGRFFNHASKRMRRWVFPDLLPDFTGLQIFGNSKDSVIPRGLELAIAEKLTILHNLEIGTLRAPFGQANEFEPQPLEEKLTHQRLIGRLIHGLWQHQSVRIEQILIRKID